MVHRSHHKRELILATRNSGKITEIYKHLEGLDVDIRSLLDYPQHPEIEEAGISYSENALIKAMAVHEATGAMVLAEDSGLEIDALQGGPGVHSARHGGEGLSDEERNDLILRQLKDVPQQDRGARFVCVAVIVDERARPVEFRGTLEGYIGQQSRGGEGFGYDPIFCLHDSDKSLAQLGLGVKSRISHRAGAMRHVRSYLERLLNNPGD